MKQKLQANIQGFGGRPASVFGVYDDETGVLVVVKQSIRLLSKNPDCTFITNKPRSEHDFFLDESEMLTAIRSYYRLKTSFAKDNQTTLLSFSSKAGAADPVSRIRMDGVSNAGREYSISSEITNLQVATLAMCLYVEKGRVIADTLDMFDALNALSSGELVTI